MALKPLHEFFEISDEDAAEYLGAQDPSEGQRKALTRLSRSAVENVSLHLNREFAEELPVPAGIEEACYRMMAELYEGTPAAGSEAERHIKSVTVDDIRYEYEASKASAATIATGDAMSPPVRSLLRPYRYSPGP